MTRILFATAALAALAALPAAAQLYKCQGPDGKVVYSDQRCESKSTSSGVQGATNNANRPTLPAAPAAAPAAAADKGAPATPGKTGEALPEIPKSSPLMEAPGAPAEATGLTYSQKERLRELEMMTARTGATPEQKTGAQLEMDSIRSGRESRLSSDARSRRDSLVVDLGSVDKAKRAAALRELRNLYH